ncbi:MAG: carbamoyl transferase [Candidatus Niyogibacteria bacterium]|nr:carbamoyl transferase [Candidatus Niyogibacteria bacterium]
MNGIKILGIVWEMCSGAALMIDGRVIAAASEERFSRVKNDERYPLQAIEYVLKEGGIKPEELDIIAFAGTIWNPPYVATRRYTTFSQEDRIREQKEYWHPRLYEKRDVKYLDIFKDKIDTDQYPGPQDWVPIIDFLKHDAKEASDQRKHNTLFFQEARRSIVSKHLCISSDKIIFIDHHSAHAFYAFFASQERKNNTLILTADAWGDDANATISVVKDDKIKRLSASNNFAAAKFYRYVTLILGMKPDEHEYKVMGLAPYAKKQHIEKVLQMFQDTQYVNGLEFNFHKKPTDSYYHFKELFEGQRFDTIAGALQKYTEDILLKWAQNAFALTQSVDICFGGGIAMNVKAMMEINCLPGVNSLFVPPTPSDESHAIGCMYVAMYYECLKRGLDVFKTIKPLSNAYLGPRITDDKLIINKRQEAIEANTPPSRIADLLEKGYVIGVARGRSEFGARALGNRSILADPRNISVVRKINEMIKSRDFWMPFAPVILEERASDYINGYKKNVGAQFMTLAFQTTLLGQRDLTAGLHQADLTSRPQVLKPGVNPFYEEIIKEFQKKTGVGGLLNTSFNLHGEPIVQTAEDAMRVFNLSKLDGLLINDALIMKP